jgi:hypothetical protein
LAPSAIYNFNDSSFGWAQYTYLKQNYYASHLWWQYYRLFNPIPVKLSAELELRVNINLDGTNSNSQDYWNTVFF